MIERDDESDQLLQSTAKPDTVIASIEDVVEDERLDVADIPSIGEVESEEEEDDDDDEKEEVEKEERKKKKKRNANEDSDDESCCTCGRQLL